jgi:hypothetical protein
MAAFAQFASDLDAKTRAQLDRGARLVEILKQGQYVPLPVEKQVLIIFAGTNGLLDDLPRARCSRRFEAELYKYVEQKHPDIFSTIRRQEDHRRRAEGRIIKASRTSRRSSCSMSRRPRRPRPRSKRSKRRRRGSEPCPRSRRSASASQRQVDAEDHARHEDGRGRAPQPGAAAHHRAAPVRPEDQEVLAQVTSRGSQQAVDEPETRAPRKVQAPTTCYGEKPAPAGEARGEARAARRADERSRPLRRVQHEHQQARRARVAHAHRAGRT